MKTKALDLTTGRTHHIRIDQHWFGTGFTVYPLHGYDKKEVLDQKEKYRNLSELLGDWRLLGDADV
jgi:hypothetical protein